MNFKMLSPRGSPALAGIGPVEFSGSGHDPRFPRTRGDRPYPDDRQVGNEQVPEIWENPRPLLDLQVAKKIIKNRGEIRLNIQDIVNKMAYFYHDVDKNDKLKTGSTDKVAIRRNYGTNFSISFGYTFK